MLNCNKVYIYEWFQQVPGWNRMDFLCSLINLCNPFELRFIGSFIEDLARIDYNCLRDQDMKANSAESVDQFGEKSLPTHELRSHLLCCLALLQSSNYKVASKLARLLDGHLKDVDLEGLMPSERSDKEIEECMLLLTLASYHPAFTFEMKLMFKEKLMEYERFWHRKNARCGRYYRSTSNPGAKYSHSTVHPTDNRTENNTHSYEHHQAPAYPTCNPGMYTCVPMPGEPFVNYVPSGVVNQYPLPVEAYNSYTTPVVQPHRPTNIENHLGEMKSHHKQQDNNIELTGDNKLPKMFMGMANNIEPNNISPISGDELIYMRNQLPSKSSAITSEQNLSASHSCVSGAFSILSAPKPHAGNSSSRCPCTSPSCMQHTAIPAPTGPQGSTPSHETTASTSNHYSGILRPSNCKYITSAPNLEGGDVCNLSTADKVSTCSSAQNFKRGDSMNQSYQVFSSLDPLPSKKGGTLHSKNILHPKKGAARHYPEEKSKLNTPVPSRVSVNGTSNKDSVLRYRLKVYWSDNRTSECEKTREEVFLFHEEMSSKLGKSRLNTGFLKQSDQNQFTERAKKLEAYFNDFLSSTNDVHAQQLLISFFKYPNNSPLNSTILLPLKKRKLKTESRSRSRIECDSSSSSTSSPPLQSTSRERILPPTNRPTSSLSPHSTANSISGSSVLSSPSSTANPLMDDDDPQNDPYLKLYYWLKQRELHSLYSSLTKYTFEEFANMDPSIVDSIPGLSCEDKKILNEEIAKRKAEYADKDTSLEIDMGMLALTSKIQPDIRDIVDSTSQSRSEDEKSSSSQIVPVAFETSDEAINDSLQAVASNSCFSFEFDSSSANSDSARSSKQNSEIEIGSVCPSTTSNWHNLTENRRFSTKTKHVWIQRNSSAVELPPVRGHGPPLYTSLSAPPLPQNYYTHRQYRSRSNDYPGANHFAQTSSPTYQSCHPNTLPLYTTSQTSSAPPQTMYPIVTTLTSPMLPTPKTMVLTYTPTSCYPMYSVKSPGEMTQLKSDPEDITVTPNPAGFYQPELHNTVMVQHPTMSHSPPYATEVPNVPHNVMYATDMSKPVAPVVIDGVTMPQTVIQDSETDDQVTSDTDTRMPPDAMPHNTGYYTRNAFSNGGQNFVSPNCFYSLTPNPNFFRVPGQPDNLRWPPAQHPPLGPSHSDPNQYTTTKTDFGGNVHSNHMYYVPNGYPETRPIYPLSREIIGRLPSTQLQSVPANYNKDKPKQGIISCYNCGKTGHVVADCKEQRAVEVLGNGFQLNFSQPTNNNRGGND